MKKLHIIFGTVLAASVLTGCNDFLDRAPYDEISSSTVFATADLAESVVTGCYSNLTADYVSASYCNWDGLSSVLEPATLQLNTTYMYLRGLAQSNTSLFSNRWKRLYEGVNRANDVINNISATPGMDDALKARRIAECKFIRAYEYYLLNCAFRGVPIYLENLSDAEYTRPRSTVDEVWEQCVADLTDAIDTPSLPDRIAGSSSDYGRIAKGACYYLRAKVRMWQQKWAEAEADLLKVGECGYSLFKGGYAQLFTEANERCDEMIFSIPMVDQAGQGNVFSRTYGNRCTAGYGDNALYMAPDFVDSYQWADGRPFDWNDVIEGYGDMSPRARSVFFLRDNMTAAERATMSSYGADMNQYLESGNEYRIKKAYEGRDPRLAATVITPYSVYVGGWSGAAANYSPRFPFRNETSENDIKTTQTQNFQYNIRKFVTVGTQYKNVLQNPCRRACVSAMGCSVALAECVNEQGRTTEAVAFVNQVRERAGVAPLNQPGNSAVAVSGQDDMRKRIRDEHLWELACEEVVLWDELRWGTWKDRKFGNGNGCKEIWGEIILAYGWGGNGYDVWPIPRDEVERNSNLTQNPGWY